MYLLTISYISDDSVITLGPLDFMFSQINIFIF